MAGLAATFLTLAAGGATHAQLFCDPHPDLPDYYVCAGTTTEGFDVGDSLPAGAAGVELAGGTEISNETEGASAAVYNVDGQTVIVGEGAVIRQTGDNVGVAGIEAVSDGASRIVNFGTIDVSGTGDDPNWGILLGNLDLSTPSNKTLENYGHIVVAGDNSADAILAWGNGNTIVNHGTLEAGANLATGIYASTGQQDNPQPVLVLNTGTILATGGEFATGIETWSLEPGTFMEVVNKANLHVSGFRAAGILADGTLVIRDT